MPQRLEAFRTIRMYPASPKWTPQLWEQGTGIGKTQFPVFFWERSGGFGAERMDLWGFQPRVPLRNRGVVEVGREFQEPHPSLECGARDQD